MDTDNISIKLSEATNAGSAEGFLSSFMEAYGYSRTSISRTLNGTGAITGNNVYDRKKDFLIKFIERTPFIERTFQEAVEESHNKERFVIVTDFDRLLAKDMKTKEGISISFKDLPDHYEFFNPLRGIEKLDTLTENAVDVKAAQKMSALFDEIQKTNPCTTPIERHAMNVFLNRLLFCYFADDTNIFDDGQFVNSVHQNTKKDGSDLSNYLSGLFNVLNTPESMRDCSPCYKHFPYVNGGLFRDGYPIPHFDAKSRQHLIECGEFNWSSINPDIFGSMFQTVIDPLHRSELGQHYTSVTNIMKVLKPLFLDELEEELNGIIAIADENSPSALRIKKDKKLDEFRMKLAKIKVFDPACGSGNFLITAYKEICNLEIRAIDEYYQRVFPMLSIEISHFYGIEIDDFPAEVAKLSLWLAQHQMNMECADKGIDTKPTLPLQEAGHIICGNALTTPWEEICPFNEGDIVYIASNPPFAGKDLTDEQKSDRLRLLDGCMNPGYVDYVGCWFVLAAEYIQRHPSVLAAMVSTNSVYQGMQVGLWPFINKDGVEIYFAYIDFKWKNNAQRNAGVTVTITGIRSILQNSHKFIYSETTKREVFDIGPYKTESNIVVSARTKPLQDFVNEIIRGTQFTDGGYLLLTDLERKNFISNNPNAKKFICKCVGSQEFIRGESRWCLWIDDDKLNEALTITDIKGRVLKCKAFRENSKKSGDAYKLKDRYWHSREVFDISQAVVIIPRVSSEARDYIPMGYLDRNTVITDSAFAIYNAPLWLFAILESKMHMVWMRIVCGKLETRYRYSNKLCYNTFPFPSISDEKKKQLEATARGILMAREENYEMTLAQQYDPDKMPAVLRAAHDANDMLVDSLYNPQGFANDEERLNELFKRYSKLVEKEER